MEGRTGGKRVDMRRRLERNTCAMRRSPIPSNPNGLHEHVPERQSGVTVRIPPNGSFPISVFGVKYGNPGWRITSSSRLNSSATTKTVNKFNGRKTEPTLVLCSRQNKIQMSKKSQHSRSHQSQKVLPKQLHCRAHGEERVRYRWERNEQTQNNSSVGCSKIKE